MSVRKYYISGQKRGRKPQGIKDEPPSKKGRPRSDSSLQDKGVERWECQFYYKDYTGKHRKHHKSGFLRRSDAMEYERKFLEHKSSCIDISLNSFIDNYLDDMSNRLRPTTLRTKGHIIDLHIRPYLGERIVSDITAYDIRAWQSDIISKGFSPTYCKTINNNLSAIFQYAVSKCNLSVNPVRQAGSIGSEKPAEEMEYWSEEEMAMFLETFKDKGMDYYIFLTFFYTGIRLGELLALQIRDVDIDGRRLYITKTLTRYKGEDIISKPKTENSYRVVELPDMLTEELKNYIDSLYGALPEDRLFDTSKSHIEKKIKSGARKAGIKEIRVHDLRHSHASYLISELNVPIQLVSSRLGHKRIQTTMDVYLHLYPNQNREIADILNTRMIERFDNAK